MEYQESSPGALSVPPTRKRPGTLDFTRMDNVNTIPRPNPFHTPYNSRPGSRAAPSSPEASSSGVRPAAPGQRYFHSRRVRKGQVEKPWLNKKDPREKWVTIIPLIGIAVGLALAGFLIWDGLRSVVNHKYCSVLDEDWSQGINSKVWTREVELGGYG